MSITADIDPLSLVSEAWKLVGQDYKRGRICSEATLQAALYFHLREALTRTRLFGTLEDGGVFVFAEPTLWTNSNSVETRGRRSKPDLAICKFPPLQNPLDSKSPRGEVLAVLELKFGPHWKVRTLSDMEKFAKMCNGESEIFPIIPKTGMNLEKGAVVTNRTQFFYAVVARAGARALDPDGLSRVRCQDLSKAQLTALRGTVHSDSESQDADFTSDLIGGLFSEEELP